MTPAGLKGQLLHEGQELLFIKCSSLQSESVTPQACQRERTVYTTTLSFLGLSQGQRLWKLILVICLTSVLFPLNIPNLKQHRRQTLRKASSSDKFKVQALSHHLVVLHSPSRPFRPFIHLFQSFVNAQSAG